MRILKKPYMRVLWNWVRPPVIGHARGHLGNRFSSPSQTFRWQQPRWTFWIRPYERPSTRTTQINCSQAPGSQAARFWGNLLHSTQWLIYPACGYRGSFFGYLSSLFIFSCSESCVQPLLLWKYSQNIFPPLGPSAEFSPTFSKAQNFPPKYFVDFSSMTSPTLSASSLFSSPSQLPRLETLESSSTTVKFPSPSTSGLFFKVSRASVPTTWLDSGPLYLYSRASIQVSCSRTLLFLHSHLHPTTIRWSF